MGKLTKQVLIIAASISASAAIAARLSRDEVLDAEFVDVIRRDEPPLEMEIVAAPLYRERDFYLPRYERQAPRPRDLYKQKRKGNTNGK